MVFSLWIACFPASLHSAGPALPFSPQKLLLNENPLIRFEDIPSPNFGLINAIIRDDRGFLWFGTTKGLCKYDGYQVRVLAIGSRPEGKPPEANRSSDDPPIVTAMLKTSEGTLLLGTERGLQTFNPGTEQSTWFLPELEFSRSRINALVEDSAGVLWIATRSLGLFGYNHTNGTVRRYTAENGLSDNYITTLLLDRSGKLWIGTLAGGLNVLDRSRQVVSHYGKRAAEKEGLHSDHITALCEENDRELWIGTEDGLNVLDRDTGRMRRLDLQTSMRHTIRSIARNPAGRMWFSASDLGLFLYVNGAVSQFTSAGDAGRSLSSILVLYPDPIASARTNLLLWVGTRSGVNKVLISRNPFTNHIRNQDSLELNRGAVLSLYEDREGVLWVGLWGGGLNGLRRVNGTYRRVATLESTPSNRPQAGDHSFGQALALPHNDVASIIEDRSGNLWVGTPGGLVMLDRQRRHMTTDKHVEGDPSSLASNVVVQVYEDRSGAIWVCTSGGLSRLIPEMPARQGVSGVPHRFKNYLNDRIHAHPVGGNQVASILEDHLGNHWAATYGRGLIRLGADGTATQFVYPGDSSGMSENWIYDIVEDRQGFFWISTSKGLVSFDPRSAAFTPYGYDQLFQAHIFGIYPDRAGDLWLSTSIGLVKFTPKTRTIVRFTEERGIRFKELLSGFFQSGRGTLLAGGLDGFTEFSPEGVSTTLRPPEVAITSFSVFDLEYPASRLASGEIRLTHDQNFFSLTFAALDYVNPLQNRFAYRMAGVDERWIEAGTRNYARYTHLDPGNYVFQVRGSNSENVWNEAGASVAITILPPIWQTWWFRLLGAGILAAAMYAGYKYRVDRLLEVERLRLRIADDLHDDVGSNLSSIAMVSRAVQRAPELSAATKRRLAEIYDTAVATSEGMRDIVWFIKPKNDTVDELLLRMKDTASSLLAGTKYEFRARDGGGSVRIPIDFKRNFFLGYKEILTNIVRHAAATAVWIQVAKREGLLEMTVRDNGRGFDLSEAETARRGNGLSSLRSRALKLHGECEIGSLPGTGTTVTFSGRL